MNERARAAFTLIELLVVISLAAILLAITAPVAYSMLRGNRIEVAVNTVAVALSAGRGWSGGDLARHQAPFAAQGGSYSGVAVLFTPSNEVRLTRNTPLARDGSGNLLETIAVGTHTNGLNGYADIPGREYITIPKGAGVVGIARADIAGTPGTVLLSPPFAIRFNENGTLAARQPTNTAADDGLVYYDGNFDNVFNTASGRGAAYDPAAWDAEVSSVARNLGSYNLPFETIEAVTGVLVYSKFDLRDAGLNLSAAPAYPFGVNTPARNWLLQTNGRGELVHARALFFSRYTGVVMRQPRM